VLACSIAVSTAQERVRAPGSCCVVAIQPFPEQTATAVDVLRPPGLAPRLCVQWDGYSVPRVRLVSPDCHFQRHDESDVSLLLLTREGEIQQAALDRTRNLLNLPPTASDGELLRALSWFIDPVQLHGPPRAAVSRDLFSSLPGDFQRRARNLLAAPVDRSGGPALLPLPASLVRIVLAYADSDAALFTGRPRLENGCWFTRLTGAWSDVPLHMQEASWLKKR
jgi:hypothetical protein